LAADAGEAVADAGISAGRELEFTLSGGFLEDADAGMEPLRIERGSLIDLQPTASLLLKSSIPLRNFRVRIFDESDRALASDDQSSDSEAGTDYRIGLAAALKPGHRYALVVDAQTGASFMDVNGKAYSDLRAELRILGAREKPLKKKPNRRHRR
jgi:hypothetical protein